MIIPTNYSYIYLHGYKSSPYGKKNRFLQQNLACGHFNYISPWLQDYSNPKQILQRLYSIVNMLPKPICIIGSSFGGYLAYLLMRQLQDSIAKIILINPALDIHNILNHGDKRLDTINTIEHILTKPLFPIKAKEQEKILLILQEDDTSCPFKLSIDMLPFSYKIIGTGQGHLCQDLSIFLDGIKKFICK